MEVEEFHTREWTPGETVWVTAGGDKNISGTLVSTFKDTVKLRLNKTAKNGRTGGSGIGWDVLGFEERIFHCRQIRKDKEERPPALFPKMGESAGGFHGISGRNLYKKIRCRETGMEYTIKTAAAILDLRPATVYKAVRDGKTAAGFHFDAVEWEPRKNKVIVQCIETGKIFLSVAEAADAICATRQSLRKSIEHGWAIHGYHFKRLEEVLI